MLTKHNKEHPLQTPTATDVSRWDAKRLSEFIKSIPIYKFNETYAQMILQINIDGETFLNATHAQLREWGVARIAHRGRLHAEINKMKRRV